MTKYTAAQRDLIARHTPRNSAHTPKPQVMYEKLIRDGIVWLKRRQWRPPLIVFYSDDERKRMRERGVD